jgi:hypothetical protein
MLEEHAARLEPLLARFEEAEDTAIEMTALPPLELYSLLAVDLLHETQSMDVVSLSDDWVPSLGQPAVLRSDGDLLTGDNLALVDERVAGLGRSTEDERQVAAPWAIDIGFTAVSGVAAVMKELPRRWGQLADALTRAGVKSLALPAASGDVAATTFRAILAGYGTDIVEAETNRPTLTDVAARRAVSDLRRLQPLSSIHPLAVDDRLIGELLRQGSLTSCAHVWGSTWLAAGPPAGWTLLPPLGGSRPHGRRQLRAWLLAIPRTTVDLELSRTFVDWMMAPATQRALIDVGVLPASRAVLTDRVLLAARPGLQEVVGGLSSGTGRPRLRAFPEINRVCGEAVATILAGNASPGAAFRAANAEMRRILEREGELRA